MMWEELPMASRARLMEAAVRNGYTDIRSIKAAYTNFLADRQLTGNMYSEGGDTDDFEVVNILDNMPDYNENIVYDAEDVDDVLIPEAYAYGGNLYEDGSMLKKGNSPIMQKYVYNAPGTKKSALAGSTDAIVRMIVKHEGFQSSPYHDGPGKDWYSVGFGSNNHGGAGNDANMRKILGYGWKELHNGRKMTREEAMKLMAYDIEHNLKPMLRRTLGDELYNSLTPGQLMGYLDTGYQRPASMVAAAKVHRQKGASAAVNVLGVKGYEGRNKDRRNAFTGSYLPKETVDIINSVTNIQYKEPVQFLMPAFTMEDQKLLDTPALTFYDPEYVDRNHPNYRSALADAVALDESLDTPANNWAKWNAFLSMQSDQSDPISSYSAIQQKEEPSLYQLFAPQGDDYMYHGLNFAAYGGKVNPNNSLAANSHLLPFGRYTNAINAINQTGEGYHYIIDGQTMNRKLALDYINKHKNETYAVNRYSTTSSTAGKQNEELNWQTLDANGKWIDNNEYHPNEGLLDEVVVTHPYTINNSLSQDRTYLQHTPIRDLTVTAPIDFTNTELNMFHRRDVANADAYVREALSSDVTDNIYDYMTPSAWAGLADKALEGGYNFNQLFNPTYDNQGWVGLFGADQWAKEHPEATTTINTGIDLMLPYGIKGTKTVATSTPIMNYRLARRLDKALGPSIKLTERIIPGELSPYESAVAKYSNSVNIPTGRMNWLDRLYYDALKNNDARTIKTLTEYQYATRNGILPTRVYHGSPKTDIHQFAGRKVLNSGYSDGTFLFPEEFSQNANYYISKFGRRDGKVYPLLIPMNNFKEIVEFNGLGKLWNAIPEKVAADAFGMTTKELHDALGKYGGAGLRKYSINLLARLGSDMQKDMVIANNIKDAGPIMNQTQYVLMKPQTLKLLNPVTFDDTGNIIPLSLRFNLDIYDTRFANGGYLFNLEE